MLAGATVVEIALRLRDGAVVGGASALKFNRASKMAAGGSYTPSNPLALKKNQIQRSASCCFCFEFCFYHHS